MKQFGELLIVSPLWVYDCSTVDEFLSPKLFYLTTLKKNHFITTKKIINLMFSIDNKTTQLDS